MRGPEHIWVGGVVRVAFLVMPVLLGACTVPQRVERLPAVRPDWRVALIHNWGHLVADTTNSYLVRQAPYDFVRLRFSEGLGVVRVNTGRCGGIDWDLGAPSSDVGYVDRSGRFVIATKFKRAEPFSEGLAAVQLGDCGYDEWRFIDRSGTVAIDQKFLLDERVSFFRHGRAVVFTSPSYDSGRKAGYIDTDGKMIIEARFERALPFSEGVAAARAAGKWGYIDKTGRVQIEFKFDDALSFSEGVAAVSGGGECYFVDRQRQRICGGFEGAGMFSATEHLVLAERIRSSGRVV